MPLGVKGGHGMFPLCQGGQRGGGFRPVLPPKRSFREIFGGRTDGDETRGTLAIQIRKDRTIQPNTVRVVSGDGVGGLFAQFADSNGKLAFGIGQCAFPYPGNAAQPILHQSEPAYQVCVILLYDLSAMMFRQPLNAGISLI